MQNWSRLERWYLVSTLEFILDRLTGADQASLQTILAGVLVLNATFASSSPSGILPEMMEEFGFGIEVATVTISIFVAGYCVGPQIW